MSEITSQEQLAELVEGRSDDEINAAVAAMGTESVLEAIFSAMQERFQPDKAAGQSANIGWDITTPDGVQSYQVQIADGAANVVKGSTDPTRVTLAMSLADFIRFIAGKLDGMQAFMAGKLKLQGDMMFAQTMQSWFAV